MATKAPAARARSASCGAGLAGPRGGKVERQAGGENVPEFADLGAHRVQFGADQRREIVGAKGAGVGDRPIEALEEMVGELEEVVAGALVGFDDLLRRQSAVGAVRMRVQIAAPEPAGHGERGDSHEYCGLRLRTRSAAVAGVGGDGEAIAGRGLGRHRLDRRHAPRPRRGDRFGRCGALA